MGKRFDTLLFPGFRNKAFTLSYDDGVIQDRRLVKLFHEHGVKGTFNLNYGVLEHRNIIRAPGRPEVDISKVTKEEVKMLYAGQEVGGHGLYHSDLASLGEPYAMYEIIEDKAGLEKLVGKPLEMFAYPFGFYSDMVIRLLKSAGYKGARTVRSTHSFDLPEDPFVLDPTCHHNDEKLMELAEQFLQGKGFKPKLFYVWGHGYEFDGDNNWERIEELLSYVGGHDDVWYATNGEILSYLKAYEMLEYSVDGSMIYNPSSTDLYLMTSFMTREELKAGSCTQIKETSL